MSLVKRINRGVPVHNYARILASKSRISRFNTTIGFGRFQGISLATVESQPRKPEFKIVTVYSTCMEPIIFHGADLQVDVNHRFSQLTRGNTIVYRQNDDPGSFAVKRVVALPGESVKLSGGLPEVKDRNGQTIRMREFRPHVSDFPSQVYVQRNSNFYYPVPEGHVFVMSHDLAFRGKDGQPVDSRESKDGGRSYSPVSMAQFFGRAVIWTNYTTQYVNRIEDLNTGDLVEIGTLDADRIRGIVITAGLEGSDVRVMNGKVYLSEPGMSPRVFELKGTKIPSDVASTMSVSSYDGVIVMLYDEMEIGNLVVFPFNKQARITWSPERVVNLKAEFHKMKPRRRSKLEVVGLRDV